MLGSVRMLAADTTLEVFFCRGVCKIHSGRLRWPIRNVWICLDAGWGHKARDEFLCGVGKKHSGGLGYPISNVGICADAV